MYPLILTVFIDMIGFGIVLPLLPLYAQAFGASPEVVTLVAASFTLAQSLFGPFWGWLSDRVGRKPVLLITMFGTFCAYLLLAFASTLWMLFAVRFLGGAMAANMGVAQALVTDVTRPEERTRGIARLSGAAGLGFVAGPAIGGLLAGAENPDFAAPYLAAAAFSAVAFLLVAVMVRETVTPEQRTQARDGSWLRPVRNRQTRLVLCLLFMTPFVFAGIEVIVVLWSERAWNWGPSQNGYFYAWMGLCHVAFQWFAIGPLARRFGERAMVTAGAFCLGFGVLWMPLAQSVPELYAAAFLMILGVSMNAASLNALLSQYAAPENRGRLMGLGQMSAGAGRIAGPVLAGIVFANLGISWPFFAGAMVMVAMAALSRRISRRRIGQVPS